MKRYILQVIFASISVLIFSQNSQPAKEGKLKYYDQKSFLIEGTTFTDSVKENLYDRFPLSYKNKVREPVWNLSKSSKNSN